MRLRLTTLEIALAIAVACGCGSVNSAGGDAAAGTSGQGGQAGSGTAGSSGSAGSSGAAGSGSAGTTGAGGSNAGSGGSSGAAGIGGATGSAGRGGTTGSAGRGGTTGSAGTGGATGSGGRGGGGGNAGSTGSGGSVAGRGGGGGSTGGVGGSTGGVGGSTARGGSGGTASPCQALLALDRSCSTQADCFAGAHTTDCCGNSQATGFRNSVMTQFQTLKAQCDATYPACGCPAGPPIADDGSRLRFSQQPGVTCLQGKCTTFVPDCGQPCAAGTTCFSCVDRTQMFAACTTTCADSNACTNPSLPLCQMGTSGNTPGKFCTAANVQCDSR